MKNIAKHDALILIINPLSCFYKLHFTLRCSPCSGHVLLDRYDALLREGLPAQL